MRRRSFATGLPAVLAAGALSACGVKVTMVRPTPTLIPDTAVPRIDVQAAYDKVRAGAAMLVDVRGDDPWRARHASGAISVPIEDIESAPLKALAVVPSAKQPILYCT